MRGLSPRPPAAAAGRYGRRTEEGQRSQPRCRSGSPATGPSGPGATLDVPRSTPSPSQLPWTQGANGGHYFAPPLVPVIAPLVEGLGPSPPPPPPGARARHRRQGRATALPSEGHSPRTGACGARSSKQAGSPHPPMPPRGGEAGRGPAPGACVTICAASGKGRGSGF
jgi:hypothetical protein